jgi:hypothetical protein
MRGCWNARRREKPRSEKLLRLQRSGIPAFQLSSFPARCCYSTVMMSLLASHISSPIPLTFMMSSAC